MSILIVVEHDNRAVRDNTRAVITAAKQLAGEGGRITALVLGDACEAAAQDAATLPGVSEVRLVQHGALADRLGEPCAAVIAEQAREASHVLMAAGAQAREWLPRAAALADAQMLSDVLQIESPSVFVRPLYAGNALATVESNDAIKFLSVRITQFAPCEGAGSANAAAVVAVNSEAVASGDWSQSAFVEARESDLTRPELTTAKIVISGGRGVGSAENFQLLERVADLLNAAVGASRAAVDAGYVPNDYQVGQTGKIVAPDLYLAVGISGAIQHIAGMKDSKCIVAINKDADAPIFEVSDYGLVADLFEAMPALEQELKTALAKNAGE